MSERLRIYDGITVRGQFLDVDIYPTTDGMVRIGFCAPINDIPSLNGRRVRLGHGERSEEYDRNRLVLSGCTLTCTASSSANVPQYREQVVVDLDEDVASDLRELLPLMFNTAHCCKRVNIFMGGYLQRPTSAGEEDRITELVASVLLDKVSIDSLPQIAERVLTNWHTDRDMLLAGMTSQPVQDKLNEHIQSHPYKP